VTGVSILLISSALIFQSPAFMMVRLSEPVERHRRVEYKRLVLTFLLKLSSTQKSSFSENKNNQMKISNFSLFTVSFNSVSSAFLAERREFRNFLELLNLFIFLFSLWKNIRGHVSKQSSSTAYLQSKMSAASSTSWSGIHSSLDGLQCGFPGQNSCKYFLHHLFVVFKIFPENIEKIIYSKPVFKSKKIQK